MGAVQLLDARNDHRGIFAIVMVASRPAWATARFKTCLGIHWPKTTRPVRISTLCTGPGPAIALKELLDRDVKMNLIEANQPKRVLSWSKAHLQVHHILTTLEKAVSNKGYCQALYPN